MSDPEPFDMKLDNGMVVSGLGSDQGPVLHMPQGGTLNGHRFEAGDVAVLDYDAAGKLIVKINGRLVDG